LKKRVDTTFWPSNDESRRIRRIAHVLFDNQLGYFVDKLRLRGSLPFEKRIKTAHFKDDKLAPQRLLKVFEELDGSFIKLGQLLSLRPDLIPAEYCEELSKLQDKVHPFPAKEAIAIIEKELNKPLKKIFSEFNETPIAAASMGQVHIATLKDGTKVAVKVQRPSVQATVKTDIKLLYRLAAMAAKRYGTKMVNPVEIVREFERYTESELNYLKEAHHIDLFHKNFEKSQTIIVPKVYWNYTTNKVLTMEYIPGTRLTAIERFKPAERKKIINTILNAEFEQMFMHGLFHADPHPGNFLIKRNGKIALLDFGIVGRFDQAIKENITGLFVNMMNANVQGMIESVMKLGAAPEHADMPKLKDALYDHISQYYGTTLSKVKMSKLFTDVIRIMKENNLKALPNFVLFAKATMTLEGLALRMDPDLDLVQISKPFVKRIERERLNPRKIAERAKRKVDDLLQFAQAIPQKTNTLLTEIHDTDRDLRRIDRDISTLSVEIDRSSNRLTLGFLAGTLFIAATMMIPFQKTTLWGVPAFSLIGYVIALIVLLAIFLSMIKEKKI
jgi:ubiquinone biosynthesis protein